MARYKFTTAGDYVTFKDGDNVVATLHNTSRAIEWYYDSTGGLIWEVDGVEYQTDDIANIEFDGVACNSQDDFETGIEDLFPGYAPPVGYPAGTKMYVALLTQSGTSAPVATVLVNTLGGTVVWSYSSVGVYNGTLAGAFVENKTVILTQNYVDYQNLVSAVINRGTSDVIEITSFDTSGFPTIAQSNNVLTNATIQILVFP